MPVLRERGHGARDLKMARNSGQAVQAEVLQIIFIPTGLQATLRMEILPGIIQSIERMAHGGVIPSHKPWIM